MEDKRSHQRVPIDIMVGCEPKGAAPFQARGKDVSVGGMFLESGQSPAFGTELTIVAMLPGAKKDLRLPAVVRWVKPGGFGVQFGLLGALETHVLSELMKEP
ncbi:MAG TPA: PilZ domain-containing protein [Polyangiaceae bacterium]